MGEIRGERVNLTCRQCSANFTIYASELRNGTPGRGRFCSVRCADQAKCVDRRCTKCGGVNERGGRTRLCQACLPVSPTALARERAKQRRAECPDGKRWCSLCDEFLPPAQFSSKDHICAACLRTRNLAAHLSRSFGLTQTDYDILLDSQEGRCAICRNAPKKQRLHVDHDHETGRIRGLLCLWCNHRLLGSCRGSADVLRRAAAYLDQPPAPDALGERHVPENRRRR